MRSCQADTTDKMTACNGERATEGQRERDRGYEGKREKGHGEEKRKIVRCEKGQIVA